MARRNHALLASVGVFNEIDPRLHLIGFVSSPALAATVAAWAQGRGPRRRSGSAGRHQQRR